MTEDDLLDMEHLLATFNETQEPESRVLLQAKLNATFPALVKEVQHLQDVLRGKRYEGQGEPWPERREDGGASDAELLRSERSAHAHTLRNLDRANKWIAKLERDLHARGGPAPRIAHIVEAQGGGEARPPSLPPDAQLFPVLGAWQRDPPTQDGYYWALENGREPKIVEVFEGNPGHWEPSALVFGEIDNSHPLSRFEWWGPRIDPPPAPKDD